MESFIFYYLLVCNMVAFTIMYVDKKRAIQGKYRIRERTLWTFSFLGGALGAMIAMEVFRHKTKHIQFKLGLPAITVIEGLLIYWFLQ